METPIHYLKARKSDFLAGTDLEIFELEGKSKTLTVKKIEYKENFNVNGRRKEKGLIMHFAEGYAKPLVVNSTNSRIIRDKTGIIDASKWVGFSVEFYFNTNVEMKKQKVGGIRISKVNMNGLFAPLEDTKTRISQCSNRAEIMVIWNGLSEKDQIIYKDEVTSKVKTFK